MECIYLVMKANGTVSLIIGVAGTAGSYFRYVSKQTVRTTKK